MIRQLLLVALGGALGSAARFLASVMWPPGDLPWATFAVNLAGSFLIGVVTAWALAPATISEDTRLFLTTGVMGGLTTYSTFSLEAARMLSRQEFALAGAYIGGTTVLCIVGCSLGLATGRAVWP